MVAAEAAATTGSTSGSENDRRIRLALVQIGWGFPLCITMLSVNWGPIEISIGGSAGITLIALAIRNLAQAQQVSTRTVQLAAWLVAVMLVTLLEYRFFWSYLVAHTLIPVYILAYPARSILLAIVLWRLFGWIQKSVSCSDTLRRHAGRVRLFCLIPTILSFLLVSLAGLIEDLEQSPADTLNWTIVGILVLGAFDGVWLIVRVLRNEEWRARPHAAEPDAGPPLLK